jgi:hypothetical protein
LEYFVAVTYIRLAAREKCSSAAMSIASATSQDTNRAINALVDA